MATPKDHIGPDAIASGDSDIASNVIKVQNDDELRLAQMGTTATRVLSNTKRLIKPRDRS